MRVRNLEHHQLVSIGPERYMLRDHPEIVIRRHYGSGGYRGWIIDAHSLGSESHETSSDLAGIDRDLLRYGDCHDCGKFSRRHGHPRHRCKQCNERHQEMVDGYKRGKAVVEQVDRLWEVVTQIRAAESVDAAVVDLINKPRAIR